MIDINHMLSRVSEISLSVAQELLRRHAAEAHADVETFLEQRKWQLQTIVCRSSVIGDDQFRALVEMEVNSAEMTRLRQAGVSQRLVEKFLRKLVDIIVVQTREWTESSGPI